MAVICHVLLLLMVFLWVLINVWGAVWLTLDVYSWRALHMQLVCCVRAGPFLLLQFCWAGVLQTRHTWLQGFL
jgi:hypothetical protein